MAKRRPQRWRPLAGFATPGSARPVNTTSRPLASIASRAPFLRAEFAERDPAKPAPFNSLKARSNSQVGELFTNLLGVFTTELVNQIIRNRPLGKDRIRESPRNNDLVHLLAVFQEARKWAIKDLKKPPRAIRVIGRLVVGRAKLRPRTDRKIDCARLSTQTNRALAICKTCSS